MGRAPFLRHLICRLRNGRECSGLQRLACKCPSRRGASPLLPSQARGKPAKDHQRSPPPTSEHARAPYGAVCGSADDSPGAELGAELRGLGAELGASSGGMRAREGARDVASPEPKDDDHDGAGEEQPLVRP